jgi:hypothetical protein
VNRIRQLWRSLQKIFDLPQLIKNVRDRRQYPEIPTPCLHFTLVLGALLRVPSLLDLSLKTRGPGWQRLIGSKPFSDDTLGYVLEHGVPEDWRAVLVAVNRTLKENKQLEGAKLGGLLVVAIDANEQFKSRSRCCSDCCQRQVKIRNDQGQEEEVTEYYHRQVYAQINGPELSTILDLEPIRPGEDEVAAALRMLGRIRRLYGVRFFDAVTVDAWYTKGPFILAVEKLGWGVISVLKQERYEIYQEVTALLAHQTPLRWEQDGRHVVTREVKDLDFTDSRLGKMRVVVSEEQWTQTQVIAAKPVRTPKQSHWRWLVSQRLDSSIPRTIHQIGHRRWGIENHAFNELTQYYGLEHCARHEPVAIVVWLLIRVLGLVLFEWYAKVHCKSFRLGRQTLKNLCDQLKLDLGRWEELEVLWSG